MNNKTLQRWAPFVTAIAMLLLWQAVCTLFSIADFIFPSPLTIAQAMGQYAAPIAEAAWKTFWRMRRSTRCWSASTRCPRRPSCRS
jgi:NitT/TauT family transport system permease protein